MAQRICSILTVLLSTWIPSSFAQTVADLPNVQAPAVTAAKKVKKKSILDVLTDFSTPSIMAPPPQHLASKPSNLLTDMDKNASLDPGEVVMSISNGNKAMEKIKEIHGGSDSCSQAWSRAMDIKNKFSKATVSDPQLPPTKNENSLNNPDVICGSRDGNYDICIPKNNSSPCGFKFYNTSRDRDWNFYFQDNARQDLGFSISEGMSTKGVPNKETYMMIFPRKYLPSIKIKDNYQIVTLPNGETITYDANTKKILSGVLDDGKVYSGSGVVLRADRTGNDARFSNSAYPTVTVTKQGKSCKVPKKSLWPDQSGGSALHFKYATDESFDAFLKKKCGFGLN